MPRPVPPDENLEPIETASVDELRAVQLRRLRRSLRHAYDNVGHYRKSFESACVHPDDVRDLSDLANFPLTTKEDLRAGSEWQAQLITDFRPDIITMTPWYMLNIVDELERRIVDLRPPR